MAGTGLLVLLDDITSLLDDIVTMTKITVALFMVGGGILLHNIHYVGEKLTSLVLNLFSNETAVEIITSLIIGIGVGAIVMVLVMAITRLLPTAKQA